MKKIVTNICLILSALIFIFVILEIIFVLLNPGLKIIKNPSKKYNTFKDKYPEYMTYNEDLGWMLKPNFKNENISINKNGFRSFFKEDFYTSNQPKILMLGDSMVFGNLLNQQDLIFSERLNKKQVKYSFINTGVSGWSTVQEYLGLTKFIKIPNIKKIILFHTVSNDMWTNVKKNSFFPYVELTDDKLIFFKGKKKFKIPYYKTLMIYQFIDEKFLKGRDLQYIYNKVDFWIRGEKSNVWKIHLKLLEKINYIAKKNSIPLIIVDIPTQKQIKNKNKIYKRQGLMNIFCKENKIIYYNLLEHYPKNASKLFIKNDSHWNILGHDFMFNFIMENLLN